MVVITKKNCLRIFAASIRVISAMTGNPPYCANLKAIRYESTSFKLCLHDEIYWLRFYPNPLILILSLSNSHSNVASMQKNPGDKSHRVIVA